MAATFNPRIMDICIATLPRVESSSIPPKPKPRDVKYTVEHYRVDDRMLVKVSNGFSYLFDPHFHKYISLKDHWWRTKSPAYRIKLAVEKAEHIAERLNHDDLIMQHEADISTR